MAIQRIRDTYRYTKPQHPMRDGKHVQTPIAQKDGASSNTPQQGRHREYRIWQMCNGEEKSSRHNRVGGVAGNSKQTKKKKILQDELLQERPHQVSPNMQWQRFGTEEWMQEVRGLRDADCDETPGNRGSDDPETFTNPTEAEP